MDVVMHWGYSIDQLFGSERGQFAVLIEVYGVQIAAIETSIRVEWVCSGGCAIVDKFKQR